MKYFLYTLIIFIIFFCSLRGQSENYHLDFKATIKSNDSKQELVLFNRGNIDDVIDGYILITKNNRNIEGKIQKGGFNFLEPSVFEIGVESLRRKWVENNFPINDVTNLTNGVDIEKVYSFEITPVILNIQSDSLNFYIKGVFFNLKKQNDKVEEYNLNYDVHFSYKLFKIPYNKIIALDFLDKQFKDYTCSIIFNKIKKLDEYLSIKNDEPLFNGIKQSASESTLPTNLLLNIGTGFIRTKADNEYQYMIITPYAPYNFLLSIQRLSLEPINALVDKQYNDRAKLPVDAYRAELTFPFQLYNKEKVEIYKNYKTEKEIFQSKYNMVVVPISLNEDTLTADVFLNYSKISLNDGIPRWTPIKKRIKLIEGNPPIALDLPKENWSANFTREGEKYDIYGYSDFERYVNEYLLLSFNSVKQINGN